MPIIRAYSDNEYNLKKYTIRLTFILAYNYIRTLNNLFFYDIIMCLLYYV